jgi:hypothetical protein
MLTPKTIFLSCALLVLISGNALAAPESRKIEEVTGYNWEMLMAQLDFSAVLLQNEPAASVHIIVYDGQPSLRGEADGWMHCIKNYMVALRGIEASRIRVVNGGHRQTKTVELWLITATDELPKATPTIQPKDVKFKKGRLKNWKSL